MTDKVLCPWCGAEMYVCYSRGRVLGEWRDYYDAHLRCTKCGAQGPFESWNTAEGAKEAARAAALRRYTPPLKPMTLEEAYEAEYCYLEHDTKGMDTQIVMLGMMSTNARNESRVEILEFGEDADYCGKLECSDYGKTWRCWERKPTDEERSAAGWET